MAEGPPANRNRLRLLAGALIAALLLQRGVYHAAYLLHDPFALVTFSDGQLYEEAARDIVAHPPFGTQPLYLQGLYAYVLALGIALRGSVVDGLCVQLALSLGALWLLVRACRTQYGPIAGTLSVLVLLACSDLAFYENKYLSVAIGNACNALAIVAFVAASRSWSKRALLLLGVASGLCVLGRPNLLIALPFTLLAVMVGTRGRLDARGRLPLMAAWVCGLVLALAPLALRNQLVIGRPDVLPSHGGGIPFYIGNNPSANGRWNNAGGLLSGQVSREREELAEQLGVHEQGAALDEALGRKLYGLGFAYITQHPGAWLELEGKKLWFTLGNHRFIRDYDLFGERELLAGASPVGLPFGVLLGLGVLGLWISWQRQDQRALCVMLLGQVIAVLAANLLWFTSSQNRVPLVVPLAFASGPALAAIGGRLLRDQELGWPPAGTAALACAALLCAQAFVPRLGTYRASSVHYYNLATVEEQLGRNDAALRHYRVAMERNADQPMFALRFAHLSRLLHHDADAERAFRHVANMAKAPRAVRELAARELQDLAKQPRAAP